MIKNMITKKNEREQFNDVIRTHQQMIFAYIFRIVKNYQDAEDLTQDTFVKAYRKMDTLKDNRKIKSWLYQIAYHTAMDYVRKRSVLLLFDASKVNEVVYEVDYFSDETTNEIMATLNYKEHTLMTLRVLEEMSYEEISSIMHVSSTVLRKRYERLIKKLRKQFLDKEGEIFE